MNYDGIRMKAPKWRILNPHLGVFMDLPSFRIFSRNCGFTAVSQRFHSGFTVVSQWFHSGFTVVSRILQVVSRNKQVNFYHK